MGHGRGKKPRSGKRVSGAYTVATLVPQHLLPLSSTSIRCKATHDVPYTLRCVKSTPHSGFPHSDSEGRDW